VKTRWVGWIWVMTWVTETDSSGFPTLPTSAKWGRGSHCSGSSNFRKGSCKMRQAPPTVAFLGFFPLSFSFSQTNHSVFLAPSVASTSTAPARIRHHSRQSASSPPPAVVHWALPVAVRHRSAACRSAGSRRARPAQVSTTHPSSSRCRPI
jgi:hypothetical protein